jgi:hypothetical protein
VLSQSIADAARWWDDEDWKHYNKHRGQFGRQTVEQYDKSARKTIRLGIRFTYRDPDYGAPRVGYFTPGNGRFTVLNRSETRIITHFIPDDGEEYVRGLPESTYAR